MPPNYIQGDTKRCNGALHKGIYVSLVEFYIHKKGRRKGKPFSQCKACYAIYRFGDPLHGYIPYSMVKFIFDELKYRLGKLEASRRIGVSQNFYWRENKRVNIRRKTVYRGMMALMDCREKGEVRHKDSIRHGAARRGRKEKVPQKKCDYYSQHYDNENMAKVKAREEAFLTSYME